MHHSRLCAVLIDCKTDDVDEAARQGPHVREGLALFPRPPDQHSLKNAIQDGEDDDVDGR